MQRIHSIIQTRGVLPAGLPYYESIVVEVVLVPTELTPFLPSFRSSFLLPSLPRKKRFKMPAMNADDPTRCPNIWIPRHVAAEGGERESILAKGPASTSGFHGYFQRYEISRASVWKCTLARNQRRNMSKLKEIRAAGWRSAKAGERET